MSTPGEGSFSNAPSFIVFVTVFASVIWLLVCPVIAGDAATRDIQTRMFPITYSQPISKRDYLAGRFLAALAVNLLIVLAIPIGILLSFYLPGIDNGLVAPFDANAYLSAHFLLAMPTVFVATTVQFTFALKRTRVMASYIASVLLFVGIQFSSTTLAGLFDNTDLARIFDLIGTSVVNDFDGWTPIEKNTKILTLSGTLLASRLIWLSAAILLLAYAYVSFRFERYDGIAKERKKSKNELKSSSTDVSNLRSILPEPLDALTNGAPNFSIAYQLRQLWAISWSSYLTIVRSRVAIAIVGVIAFGFVLFVSEYMEYKGIPILARSEEVVALFSPPLANLKSIWVIIPLLIILYAGELVWRERESGVSEISDATPVSEWVIFTGKFVGLCLILLTWQLIFVAAGIAIQLETGYPDIDVALYCKILIGLQLPVYVLFALLTLAIHAIVNNKYLGHLVAFVAFAFLAFHHKVGIHHNLLVYASGPRWSYTDMRGFGSTIAPWLWFKLYWYAIAILLACLAIVFLKRGRDSAFNIRVNLARARFPKMRSFVMVTALVTFIIGSFVFYNTNIANEYLTTEDLNERQAEYELKYSLYKNTSQPLMTSMRLSVDVFPKKKRADIEGTFVLKNNSERAMEAIHVSLPPDFQVDEITFNRGHEESLVDDKLKYRIYTLHQALQPGDSIELRFKDHFEQRFFSNDGIDPTISDNGSYFWSYNTLPAIGYQVQRELRDDDVRKQYGLPSWRPLMALLEFENYENKTGKERINSLEVVLRTDNDQIAIATGDLIRSWSEGDRKVFHYKTSSTIGSEFAIYSAHYAVHRAQWHTKGQAVDIEIYHHPGHTNNLQRMVYGAQSSLAYYTKTFGPYPFKVLRFIEYPGHGNGMHAEAMTVTSQEGFSLLNPGKENFDLPFLVVSHEVAHQWWGHQFVPGYVEGIRFLVEGLAVFSSMQVLEETYGRENLQKYLSMLRADYELPRSRAMKTLLKADDSFLSYRKGPFALYAMSHYIGKDSVINSLRKLFNDHRSGKIPHPTTLDLYRQLKIATPDTLHYLLRDLFETNTFWDLKTNVVSAKKLSNDQWQVELQIESRKFSVDSLGNETNLQLDDWIEIGAYGPKANSQNSPILYLEKHKVTSSSQTITISLDAQPARVGIDPQFLLMDWKLDDNVKVVNH